jgi:hypothetical protein
MRKPGDMFRRLKRQDPLIGNIQDNETNMSTAVLGVAKYRYEGQLKEAKEQGRVSIYYTSDMRQCPKRSTNGKLGGDHD